MEKSHHVAKASTQAHSQHRGTKARTSVVVQQYKFWYRNIQHRYLAKLQKRIADEERGPPNPVVLAAASRRRDAWYASTAAAGCDSWRAQCSREGSCFVELDKGENQQGQQSQETSSGDGQSIELDHGSQFEEFEFANDSVTDIT